MRHPVQTLSPFLPSAGFNYRKATRHQYSHSELVTLADTGQGTIATGLGHFYRCSETGELRRWGFDATFAKEIN